jgi:pimeloyl-ACP methyl ester carboxylesterase
MVVVMKDALRYIKNLSQISLTVRNQSYPVHVYGNGSIPLFSVGIGSHLQMTIPESLLDIFTIYSTDLYWISSQRWNKSIQLAMVDFVDDIFDVLTQLKLSQCIIAGFSAFGLLALEAAKRKDPRIKGVVMISTPPGWNNEIIAKGQNYFNQFASEERKLNDLQRKAYYLQVKQPEESIVSINAYEADAARYWKDFNLSHDFFECLWEDILVDDDIINHFFSNLLPSYTVTEQLEKITSSIIIFAGLYDFDSAPHLQWDCVKQNKKFTIIKCEDSGHWPQLESPILFETYLRKWLSNTYRILL